MRTQILSTFALANTKDGCISLAKISEPYGLASGEVLSIAVCLKPGVPEWKIHLPPAQIDELIIALQTAKGEFKDSDKLAGK